MASLNGKTIIVTGASRGIGLAIALRAARDGANIVVAAKTAKPHPKLPGTIHSAAEAIREAGGEALPIEADLRDEKAIELVVSETIATFGGVDALVNNAGAIDLTGTLETPLKRFDLMMSINTRATFAMSQACLPHLLKAESPHIVMMAPPVNLNPKWLSRHLPYTLSKYGMSLCVLGLAEEYRKDGLLVNALWPRTVIDTSALNQSPDVDRRHCRTPEIVADAAHVLLTTDDMASSGRFFVDEEVLRATGVEDFSGYACAPGEPLLSDLFME